MKTATARTPSARKATPATTETQPHMMSRAEMLKAAKPAVRKILEGAKPKSRDFILDILRLGRAGVIK